MKAAHIARLLKKNVSVEHILSPWFRDRGEVEGNMWCTHI